MNFVAIIIGAVTGFVSAFFGIGGSSIDTPVIRTFLGLPPLQSLATPLPLTVLTASIAMFAYRKGHLADYRITGLSLITAVPGVVLDSLLTDSRQVPDAADRSGAGSRGDRFYRQGFH